jgi:hypothetical protein
MRIRALLAFISTGISQVVLWIVGIYHEDEGCGTQSQTTIYN